MDQAQLSYVRAHEMKQFFYAHFATWHFCSWVARNKSLTKMAIPASYFLILWAAVAKIAAASISSPRMSILDFAPGAQSVTYRSQRKQYREINVSAKIILNKSVKSCSSFVITSLNYFARSLPVPTWSARRPAPGTKDCSKSMSTPWNCKMSWTAQGRPRHSF